MCGVFFSLHGYDIEENTSSQELVYSLCANLRKANAERGPDRQSSIVRRISDPQDLKRPVRTAEFYGSELRLRGEAAIQQPHELNGNILCWNGEIFGGLEVGPQENDGVKLLEALAAAKEADEIIGIFGRLEGPYGFVYYHAALNQIFFARDPLGRRSLLVHRPTAELPALLISSVSSGTHPNLNFEEVSTDCIHCLDIPTFDRSYAVTSNFVEACESSTSQLPRCPQDLELPYAAPAKVNPAIPSAEFPQVQTLGQIPDYLQGPVDEFLAVLDKATWLRVRDIPRTGTEGSARVSVLFSGGIDSTVVAYLAHKHVPLDEPIDLFNVGFENPRKMKLQQAGNIGALPRRQQKQKKQALGNGPPPAEPSYRVPDRVTGLQELEELRRLCPGRTWNFVEVNVPYEETQNARERVEDLMLPSRTVMDLSLALALYFAARGKGQIRSAPAADPVPYISPARVVLSGLGSDELLGGYGRHRTAYGYGGWPAVIEELQLEIDRIPTRNLGRDDRIISSHGKETRHPFLSLDVVSFVAGLPVHYKMDPRLETGTGDKMLLRLLTQKLGLVEASCRKKRAMQFGSHSARMDGEKKGDAALAE
ncbi:hypothetical protein D9611_003371 [Ephemerocybe angulata]|uniref:Asparagine synthetase domain-containing protein n=1 Tax=Ephemerocybe angulata TaxID=980116 RepID=A0A8H5C8L3_9AGAR|nr:hypothetical protein D9611_003371 [Tulosesus angulatus]